MSDKPDRPWGDEGLEDARAGAGLEATDATAPLARPQGRVAADRTPPRGVRPYPAPAQETEGATEHQTELLELEDGPEHRVGWGKAALAVLGAASLLGALYVGLAYWAGTHVPQNTHVRGLDIGGATKEDAAATLRSRLGPVMAAPVTVQGADEQQKLTVDPAAAGLAIDYDATLDGVTGQSFHPTVVWERLTGNGKDLPLRTRADHEKLTAALAEKGASWKKPAREGRVELTKGAVQTTAAEKGSELDVEATAAVVEQSWPTERPVPASLRTLEPVTPQAEIDRFTKDTANVVVSGPVTLKVGDKTATLDRGKITDVTSVVTEGGKLSLKVDQDALLALVRTAAPAAETQPKDASVQLKDGKAQIVPEANGKTIDKAALAKEFTGAITRTAGREATVPLTEAKPRTTAEQLKGMNLSTPMAEFRSRFPGGEENEGRTHNITVGLKHIDGTVVQPGEQFSLLKKLGAMDASQGYVNAGVIINGMPAEAMAGGLSQVSTVVYNTSYFAGVQLDEHTAHSYYISRYPAGREATIWSGQIDNKWTNNTPAPIVIETHIEGSEVVMRFWGQKVYDVESVSSDRYAITQPQHRSNPAANCQPDHGMEEGFTITVTRILSKGGTEVKREPVTTTYIPADGVTCTNPNAPGYGK